MSLKAQITDDMKTAMKAGDKDRLKVVRLILAAIKQVEVDTRSELDDTAVLVSSDHGEAFYEHGAFGHHEGLFDELVHVPLIVAGPGVAPGAVDEPTGLVGLPAGLLELLDVEPAPNMAPATH